MGTKPIGVYVHIPFCKRKCNYCDFCSVSADEEKIKRYADALCYEIEHFSPDKRLAVNTLFFGGGTPSLISSDTFVRIMDCLKKSFDILPSCEITAEVNPGTVSEEKAKAFFDAGVNRISIGLQSIHENELKILGRIHTFEDFIAGVELFRRTGFSNISVDLMYGIPEQTVSSFEKTLDKIIELNPEHISAYGLIIEEGTPFFQRRENLPLPSEDEEYEMYLLADKKLSLAGYAHYEISNYAKAGYASRHNLRYWHNEEYVGFGISAHSYFRGKRFYNTSDFDEYFTLDSAKYRKDENDLSGTDPFEYAMLALRLSEGLSLLEYESEFGVSFLSGKEREIERFSERGLLKIENGRLSLTPEGFYLSNTILSELL